MLLKSMKYLKTSKKIRNPFRQRHLWKIIRQHWHHGLRKNQVEEKPLVAPSLKEIQQIEAAQRMKVRNSEAQPAPPFASSIASSPTTSKPVAASLPSAVNWAKPSSSAGQPMKTLAQIQKEEEAAAKKRLLTQTAQSVPTAAGGKRYADIAAPPGTMLRAAQGAVVSAPTSNAPSSNIPSSTGGTWTTVGPGGKKVTRQQTRTCSGKTSFRCLGSTCKSSSSFTCPK